MTHSADAILHLVIATELLILILIVVKLLRVLTLQNATIRELMTLLGVRRGRASLPAGGATIAPGQTLEIEIRGPAKEGETYL